MYRNKASMDNLLPSHNIGTRHRDNLILPLHRLSKFKHSTVYLGPSIWNNIPKQIKDAPSLNAFKNRYKNIYYSLIDSTLH